MEMLEAVKRIMEELKLPVNDRKPRCSVSGGGVGVSGIPDRTRKGEWDPTQPKSVEHLRKISEWTAPRNGIVLPGQMVEHLNRVMTGWAIYGLGRHPLAMHPAAAVPQVLDERLSAHRA